MVRKTDLTDEQVDQLAAEFGLDHVDRWEPIDSGTINSNFDIHTSEAGRFFLRVNEGKSEEDVKFEANVIRELAERGVRTPLPWKGKDERPYVPWDGTFVTLFEWVEGDHKFGLDIGINDVRQVGEALARMHVAGQELDERYQKPGIYTFDEIVKRFRGLEGSDDKKLAEAIEVIADEIAWQQERREQREAAPKGLIHHDLFPDNVMFNDRGVTLLDFEQAAWGSLVYDLAVAIDAWCHNKKGFNRHFVNEMVAGYQDQRPLSADEKSLLYAEARAAAMRFTVTRITDVYLPDHDLEDKDFRDYLARLKELRELGADEFAEWAFGG